MYNIGQGSEAQNADWNSNSKGQAQEVLVGNKNFIGILTVCYALTEILSTFFPCPELLKETDVKCGGLANLAQ